MKKISTLIIALAIFAVFSTSPLVFAVNSTSGRTGSGSTSPSTGTATVDPSATAATTTTDSSTTNTATATTSTSSIREILKAERAAIKATQEKYAAARCSALQTKLTTQQNRFQTTLSVRESFYNRFGERFSKLIVKLNEAGYDTTKLSADLVVLNQKIAQHKTDKANFLTLLDEAKTYSCANTKSEFKTKLIDVKDALETARLSSQDIKNYYLTTIRTDLQALKASTPATTTTSDAATSATTDQSTSDNTTSTSTSE